MGPFPRSTGLSVRQILADRVDVVNLSASVIVNLDVWIEPLEYKFLRPLAVIWPICNIGDYEALKGAYTTMICSGTGGR